MTTEQYDLSIKTGKLQLSVWGKIKYYFVVVFLFLVSLALLWVLLFNNSKNFDNPPVSFIIIPAILGSLVYLNQKSGLEFRVIEINLNRNDLLLLLKKLCDEQSWSIISHEDDVFIAKTNFSVWHNTKRITILFDRNKVFVNSIFDPYLNKSGLDLFGNNREVIKIIIDCLQST